MTPEEQAARDGLAVFLKAGFAAIILEADEWRPLADYVMAVRRTVREEADAEIAHERAFRDKAPQALADAVRLAREEEREAVERAVQSLRGLHIEGFHVLTGTDTDAILAAIRARAQENPRLNPACCQRPDDCKWGGVGGCGEQYLSAKESEG